MADLNGYRAKSCTFAAASITGLTDASVNDGGTATDVVSDADSTIKGVVVDNIAVDVAITTTDITLINAIATGTSGSLVVIFEKRADGKGAAASPNKTATIADAVLVSKTASAQATAIGQATANFRAKAVAWT